MLKDAGHKMSRVVLFDRGRGGWPVVFLWRWRVKVRSQKSLVVSPRNGTLSPSALASEPSHHRQFDSKVDAAEQTNGNNHNQATVGNN